MVELNLGDVADFPPPGEGKDWPQPRDEWYPMKPTDTLLPDGRLESGAIEKIKAHQHERRFVIEWNGDHWIVARLPLEPSG